MKKSRVLIALGMTSVFILAGCNKSVDEIIKNTTTATSASTSSNTTAGSTTASNTLTEITKATSPDSSVPGNETTIPIDSNEMYGTDNPKTHALKPVVPDLSGVEDKSEPGNEAVKKEFEDYLKKNFPNHEWLLVNITDYDYNNVKYKRGEAFSTSSLDTIIWLYKHPTTNEITDSFERDVVRRFNTMNRWRYDFRPIMDELTTPFYTIGQASVDISYDYYDENIPKIKLDQKLDPKSTEYKRAMEIFFQTGLVDAEKVPEMADNIFKLAKDAGYTFNEYYVYMTTAENTKFDFVIPSSLIASPDFKTEMKNAILNPNNAINRIKPLKTNGEKLQ